MKFIQLHQNGKAILVSIDCIRQVFPAKKGGGSFIVTDIEDHDIEIDESHRGLIELLTEMEIEVDLFANDA